VLQAECAHLVGLGSDENDTRCRTRIREVGILGKKSISGMDGFRACGLGSRQDGVNLEVALRRGRRPDGNGFACLRHMHRMPVGF
jgi:hypothetical protein